MIDKIKEIVTLWRDNKCVHCGSKMVYDEKEITFKCPKCIMIDTNNNMYHALLQIGELSGVVFFITGGRI